MNSCLVNTSRWEQLRVQLKRLQKWSTHCNTPKNGWPLWHVATMFHRKNSCKHLSMWASVVWSTSIHVYLELAILWSYVEHNLGPKTRSPLGAGKPLGSSFITTISRYPGFNPQMSEESDNIQQPGSDGRSRRVRVPEIPQKKWFTVSVRYYDWDRI